MDERATPPERSDELRHHGGNINAARERYPDAPLPWIDLSTGINPVPWPVGVVTPNAWARLPELSAQAALEAAAHRAYGARPEAAIVAAPGTQALLQWLPRVRPERRVGILGFTYAEHASTWRQAGAEVATVETVAELPAFDVGIVVNPNNPDGRMVPPDVLAAMARSFSRRNGLLIVDEAFMDLFGTRDSLVPGLPGAGAIVLRSFGKAHGLAGLRLGFAIGSPCIIASLRLAMGPWAVSGPAIEIGHRALTDSDFLSNTARDLSEAADRLDGLLLTAGFTIAGGTPLFRLAAHHAALEWFQHLARAGILTRPFRARPAWLRFGIPGAPAEWARLESALHFGANISQALS